MTPKVREAVERYGDDPETDEMANLCHAADVFAPLVRKAER